MGGEVFVRLFKTTASGIILAFVTEYTLRLLMEDHSVPASAVLVLSSQLYEIRVAQIVLVLATRLNLVLMRTALLCLPKRYDCHLLEWIKHN